MKPSEKMKLFQAIESAGMWNGVGLEKIIGAQSKFGGAGAQGNAEKALFQAILGHKIRTLTSILTVSILAFLYVSGLEI